MARSRVTTTARVRPEAGQVLAALGAYEVVTSEVELLEVFRLGEAARVGDVVPRGGDRLADRWVSVSRFREAPELTSRLLRVQSSASWSTSWAADLLCSAVSPLG